MAAKVEGVFRVAAQAEAALRELREQGLNRCVDLRPDSRPSRDDTGTDLVAAATVFPPVPSGYAALFGEDWANRPLRLTVRVSQSRAPEVARLLRQFGAEEVDLS